jgi:hypothetical protein
LQVGRHHQIVGYVEVCQLLQLLQVRQQLCWDSCTPCDMQAAVRYLQVLQQGPASQHNGSNAA